jgi:RNA polymerase sigma-70 factor (ECF subfamily)
MSNQSDWELVEQARNGRHEAFTELVQRYQAPVIHFCLRMVGSREDAEDLAQEAFVRIYKSLPRLTPKAQFSTLLFGVARNLTLNAIRDQKRRGRGRTESLSPQGPEEASRALPDDSQRPDDAARLGEIEGLLEDALERVSPEHREVLLLREVQGLGYDAIGKIIRARKGTVKSRLARAREQLRLQLLELGGAQAL